MAEASTKPSRTQRARESALHKIKVLGLAEQLVDQGLARLLGQADIEPDWGETLWHDYCELIHGWPKLLGLLDQEMILFWEKINDDKALSKMYDLQHETWYKQARDAAYGAFMRMLAKGTLTRQADLEGPKFDKFTARQQKQLLKVPQPVQKSRNGERQKKPKQCTIKSEERVGRSHFTKYNGRPKHSMVTRSMAAKEGAMNSPIQDVQMGGVLDIGTEDMTNMRGVMLRDTSEIFAEEDPSSASTFSFNNLSFPLPLLEHPTNDSSRFRTHHLISPMSVERRSKRLRLKMGRLKRAPTGIQSGEGLKGVIVDGLGDADPGNGNDMEDSGSDFAMDFDIPRRLERLRVSGMA